MGAKVFAAAARIIRGIPADSQDYVQSQALTWLDDMSDHARFGLDHSKAVSRSREELSLLSHDGRGCTPHPMQTLVRFILLCRHLHADSSSAPAVSVPGTMLGFEDDWFAE